MRALWTGALSFGLINIPVRLYSASEERGLDLDMLDSRSLKPIAYSRVIKGTKNEVKYRDIVRGYKYSANKYVVLTPEDFEKASPKKSRVIEILSFTDAASIDSKYYSKPYYLEPDERATKAYALLREALRRTKKVAVAQFVMREREYIAAIKPEDDALILNVLRYEQDIRSARKLDIPTKEGLKPRELEMAVQLIEQQSEAFKPEQYKDTYTDELLAIIKAKARGRTVEIKAAPNEEPSENSDDLLAILRESLKKRSAPSRASSNGKAPAAKRAATSAKKSAAKTTQKARPKASAAGKSPARKSAAKKTTAKSSAAKMPPRRTAGSRR